jgi:hypothetical protein
MGVKKTLALVLVALFLTSAVSVYPTVADAQHKTIRVTSPYSSIQDAIHSANAGTQFLLGQELTLNK